MDLLQDSSSDEDAHVPEKQPQPVPRAAPPIKKADSARYSRVYRHANKCTDSVCTEQGCKLVSGLLFGEIGDVDFVYRECACVYNQCRPILYTTQT